MKNAAQSDRAAPTLHGWEPQEIVATTWAVIAATGWTPVTSASADRPATKRLVLAVLTGDAPSDERHRAIDNCLPAGRARASATIAAILRTTHSDAVVGATRLDHLTADTLGPDRLAPIVTAVAAQMGRAHRRGLVEPKKKRHDPTPLPVGELWQRITVTGIVTGARSIRGFVGGTHNIRLLLDCGRFGVKLISGRPWSADVELGDEITVSGEVRGHEYWHGWPATVLSDTWPVALPTADAPARRSRKTTVRHRFPDTAHLAAAAMAGRAAS